jgi:hypothetical protein
MSSSSSSSSSSSNGGGGGGGGGHVSSISNSLRPIFYNILKFTPRSFKRSLEDKAPS